MNNPEPSNCPALTSMIPATTPRKMKVNGAVRHNHAVEDGFNHVLSWYVDTPLLRSLPLPHIATGSRRAPRRGPEPERRQ